MVDLYPVRVQKLEPKINYLIEIGTHEVYDETVDVRFTIQLFGVNGTKTNEKQQQYQFENGKKRKFKFVDTDIGSIQKIRFGIRKVIKF